MNLRQIPALAILLLLCATAEARYRTWTDAQDRTVTAEFVRISNGNVVLKQNNGKVISVPFYSLSEEDQDFVRELLEAKGQGEQAPRKRPASFNAGPQGNAPFVPAGIPPLGANAAGANASGANGAGAMPPGGYGPGRMPGANAAAGHQAGGPFPGTPSMTPGANPAAQPPGSISPNAVGANPSGANPAGRFPPGSSYPGAGAIPGMNPTPAGTSPPTGPSGPGMSPLASSYPQQNPAAPSQPIGVSPVTPGMGGAPQMQWIETKTCDKCKKEVPSTSKAGDRCPHCGTYWGFETGQDGKKTYAVGYRAGKVVGGILFLLALVGTGIKKLMSR